MSDCSTILRLSIAHWCFGATVVSLYSNVITWSQSIDLWFDCRAYTVLEQDMMLVVDMHRMVIGDRNITQSQ